MSVEAVFGRFAQRVTNTAGSVWAFLAAISLILGWLVLGPVFGYSDAWQLVINTTTTIVTFLMVFVIQYAQNRETRAIQLKLNELIASMEGASNRLIDVEDVSDQELRELSTRFQELANEVRQLRGRRLDSKTSIERQAHLARSESRGRREPSDDEGAPSQ
jgi:low affinity Fe/Cu permease